MSRRIPLRPSLALAGLAVAACAAPEREAAPEVHPRIATVEALRAARAAGDLERARSFQTDDPRLWYEERVGAGSPWKLGGGRWQDWDEHFNGVTERVTDWRVDGDRVWADMFETNDYFELTFRGAATGARPTSSRATASPASWSPRSRVARRPRAAATSSGPGRASTTPTRPGT